MGIPIFRSIIQKSYYKRFTKCDIFFRPGKNKKKLRTRALFCAEKRKAMENPIFLSVKRKMDPNSDFKEKHLQIGRVEATVIYMEALIDGRDINDFLLKPLLTLPLFTEAQSLREVKKHLDRGEVYTLDEETVRTTEDAFSTLLRGCAVLFLSGDCVGYAYEAQTANVRKVAPPVDENSEQGGKESFVENIKLNNATLRKRLRTEDFVIENIVVGKQSNTGVGLCYLGNTADMKMVETVRNRLKSKNVDIVSALGVIEEAVLDEDFGMFPGVVTTERPDRFVAALNEGYIGIVTDGFPYGMILPANILQHVNAPEDYAQHPAFATAVRVLRWLMIGVTLLAPAFYIAIMNFHQEMIPGKLLLSINKAKSEVPFNEFTEILIMMIAFEIILEAGVRMPRNIGQAVSIVGGLIVGEAAINAKIVSPVVVIVVALTVMASFTLPGKRFVRSLKMWRFLHIILANFFGMVGLTVGTILLLTHLTGQEMLGVPYLAPFAEEHMVTRDTVVRMPFRYNTKRPEYLRNRNQTRRKDDQE